ncbi:molybdopterin molybdotransferase MoeA [Spiribacter halobius]|uniref:Molybdopterin molybdenumtransferase n=1 Tax=Sediminicurvatus halobius TaxID=2182432 RepID=A0A2U2MWN0_9GAMM|nr:gephyrin-like molybdotransferase Glp [Spiribacter halobius]PWG61244.1 molybdopterin molybdenumtransferase MoeA [Spiribacter halobius]UEX78435.1 molybdopterin molybdotransferase MoeA [Spiribacter halobius]
MHEIDAALALCSERVGALAPVAQSLESALGRVLAEPASSVLDLPPFAQSGLDGYAVRAADTEAAPSSLALAGEVPAGAVATERLPANGAVRVFTGAMVPPGADAVVAQERVRAEPGRIHLAAPVAAGDGLRNRGEELAAGAIVCPPGQRLHAARLAALAAAGVERVMVRPAPRVAVLVTGDEVQPGAGETAPGRIRDANGPLLRGWLSERGYPVEIHHVADRLEAVRAHLEQALAEADVVVTTGGVSVGDYDLVMQAAADQGVETVFWRVRQKPGKPLYLGLAPNGVPLLGLPGNPAAVLAGASVFLRRLLDLREGLAVPGPELLGGVAAHPVRRDGVRDGWLRARREAAEGTVRLHVLDRQASHMLSNLGEADALVRVPAGETPLPAGATVQWLPLD